MELRQGLLKAKEEYQRVIAAGDFSDETLEKEAMTDGICYWLNQNIFYLKEEFMALFKSQYPEQNWYAGCPCSYDEQKRKRLLEARIELIDKLLPLI